MKSLILVEHDNKKIMLSNLPVITAAKILGGSIDALVIGAGCEAVAKEMSQYEGVETVYVADHACYQHPLAERFSPLIAKHAGNYEAILAPATTWGKNILPRVSALLGVSMLSDVMMIESPTVYVRPMYAGNVLARVENLETQKIMTIRTTAFEAAVKRSNGSAVISALNDVFENTQSKFESESLTQSERPELTAARIVVSGGRGLKNAENFKLIEKLADQLGAAVGASRAAVDAGFVPNDYQVGQTGKVVAPDLYIAVGISGAIQHLAGMKDSKVIVAINSDPEAPIFEIVDYGLVGDLFTILPELEAALSKH